MPMAAVEEHEKAQDGEELRAFSGSHLTIHVPLSDLASERIHEYLRRADLLVAALRKIAGPPEHQTGEMVHLWLTRDHATESIGESSDQAGKTTPPVAGEWSDNGPLLLLSELQLDATAIARELTQHLVRRWFGAAAATESVFIEGLAAIAAANAGLGPPIAKADDQVREALAAERTVALSGRPIGSGVARGMDQKAPFDPAATSFTAFVLAQSGPGALQEYLAAYDPSRTDYAAIAAYHRPIAVLQEEWLSRMHGRANDREMYRSFLRRILPLLAPYRWKQAEILLYLLLAAGYNIVQPYAIKTVIDRLTAEVRLRPPAAASGSIFMQVLAPFLLLLLGIYALNAVVSLRRAYTVSWLNQNVLNTLQIKMYAHLQRLAHNFYLHAKIGDIMARLSDDLDTVQSALSQVTNKALYQSFTVVGALTALLMLTRKSPIMALPILCIVPLFAVSYAALRTRNKQASRQQRRAVGQAMADVQQHLSGHAVIKAFGLEKRFIAEYESRIHTLQKSKLRLALLSALTDLSEDTTTALAQLIIFGVGGYLVLRDGGHGLGIGDLSALLVLVKSIFSPIASLAGIGQTIQQATGAMERVTELFDEPITITDKPSASDLSPLKSEIRLEDVTFRYGGERPALSDVSLTIEAGSHVALVGLSGGGKSSIVSLLMRFWDPEQGRVLFDGHDLRDITLSSLRGQIGLVFQETFIFDTTLRENIAIGRPGATDAEIAEAAKAARLDEFIASLPGGYDTIPGENGARLSVGQKQRIAIARTFLRNPSILILDEATSALDAQTEAGILDTLGELAKGRTTVTVTHRIAQAASADQILVMDSGRLVEHGVHAELVRADGLYKRLLDEASRTLAVPTETAAQAA